MMGPPETPDWVQVGGIVALTYGLDFGSDPPDPVPRGQGVIVLPAGTRVRVTEVHRNLIDVETLDGQYSSPLFADEIRQLSPLEQLAQQGE